MSNMEKYFTELTSKSEMELPSGYDINGFSLRAELCRKYGFSIPSLEAAEVISQYGSLVEVGCGTGYWSKLLLDYGVDIIPTDLKEGDYGFKNDLVEVIELTAQEAIRKYPNRNIFCSWPSYDEEWFYKACLEIKSGNFLLYIGEGVGGCTADDQFFKIVADWNLVDCFSVPQWFGIHDYLSIWRKP